MPYTQGPNNRMQITGWRSRKAGLEGWIDASELKPWRRIVFLVITTLPYVESQRR
jgi:hypothetical protein